MDLSIAVMAFCMLFLAEMGDKTQLAVFTLAARTGNPWSVFLGGGTAMVIVTLLGAYFGGYITRYVPERYVSLAAGLLFIAFGILFIYQGLRDCA